MPQACCQRTATRCGSMPCRRSTRLIRSGAHYLRLDQREKGRRRRAAQRELQRGHRRLQRCSKLGWTIDAKVLEGGENARHVAPCDEPLIFSVQRRDDDTFDGLRHESRRHKRWIDARAAALRRTSCATARRAP